MRARRRQWWGPQCSLDPSEHTPQTDYLCAMLLLLHLLGCDEENDDDDLLQLTHEQHIGANKLQRRRGKVGARGSELSSMLLLLLLLLRPILCRRARPSEYVPVVVLPTADAAPSSTLFGGPLLGNP